MRDPVRQSNVFDFSLYDPAGISARCTCHANKFTLLNDITVPVRFDDLFCLFCDIARVDGYHFPSACSGGEKGQNSSTAANIEDDCVFEQGGVFEDERRVGRGTDLVLNHHSVDVCNSQRLCKERNDACIVHTVFCITVKVVCVIVALSRFAATRTSFQGRSEDGASKYAIVLQLFLGRRKFLLQNLDRIGSNLIFTLRI